MSGRRKKRRVLLTVMTVIAVIVLILVLLSIAAAAFSKKSSDSFSRLIGQKIHHSGRTDTSQIPAGEQGFCYESFGPDERLIYTSLYNGITAGEQEIEVPSGDMDLIEKVWSGVLADHPEFFWLTGATKMVSHDPLFSEPFAYVSPERNCGGEEQELRQAEIDKAAAAYLKTVDKNSDDYQKIKKAYEFIIDTVEYDAEAPDNQNIYSVFAGRRSVCAGYAKAFQYLMKLQDIPCIYVTGRIRERKEKHGWNIVQCHDRWYHVDVTWGDPVYNELSDDLPDGMRAMNYDYLCCTDAEILPTHTPDGTIPLPECTDGSYNFYRILDSVPLTDYDQKGFYRDEDGRLAYRDDSGRYSETGLTVTEANGTIDWGTVSDQSIDYAFISMGRYNSDKYLIEDSRWVENLAAASEAGLDAGLRVRVKIHDKESGKEQGREVIQRLQDRAPDFRGTVAVLVAEDYGRASEEQTERTTSGVVAFCRALDNAGYTPVVAGDLLNLCGLLDLTRLKNYDKWISDYGNVPYYPYEFTYWDYGKGSQINGIDGRVFLSLRIRDAS